MIYLFFIIFSETQNAADKSHFHDADGKSDGDQQVKRSPPPTPAFKKSHRGCSFCILDLDNNPVPTYPSNQIVVGVITMEDVIEELLQVTLKINRLIYFEFANLS